MELSWWKRSWTAADFEAVATQPATGWRWGSPKGAAAGIGSAESRFPRKRCMFIPSVARLAGGCVNECDPRGKVGGGEPAIAPGTRGVAVPSASLAVRKASLSNSSPGAGNHSPQPGAHGGRLQAVPLWFSFGKDRSQGTGGPDCQSGRGGAGTTGQGETPWGSPAGSRGRKA